jgi:competence protein ComK
VLEEISSDTMAIIPIVDEKYQAKIINTNGEVLSKKTPLTLIKEACMEGGSTYIGRRKAMSRIAGVAQRVPIPISPIHKMYAFPTHSPGKWECSWIFFFHVKDCVTNESGGATILFQNGEKLSLDITQLSVERQMQRTAQGIVKLSPFKAFDRSLF